MEPRHINMRGHVVGSPLALYDKWLLIAFIGIVSIGLLMLASTSIVISERQYHEPFHYLIRQSVYLFAGIILGFFVLRIETRAWETWSSILFVLSLLLLVLILIPGIGREVNGSMRWIGVNGLGFQGSELVKLTTILYLGGYLVRQEHTIRHSIRGFIKPTLVLGVIAALLLKQPDFGAAVVILAAGLGMLFLAGVRLWPFLILAGAIMSAVGVLAIVSPYRLERLTTFLDPWANPYNSGYQLTQSLIAFGRGGIWGVGLGASVQKLFYLPEAHTDFLFAVLAEELGLFGIAIVFSLYTLLIARGLLIARFAEQQGRLYAAYVAYGLSLWIAIQSIINIGVNAGVLPTKGLTLPLMSYGGSSMLVTCIAIALLLRIDHENRWEFLGLGTSQKALDRRDYEH